MPARGFSLVQLLVTLSVAGLVAAASLPPVLAWTGALRVRGAAGEIATVLRLAQAEAVRRSTHVGVRFLPEPPERATFLVYRDGDGDGVLRADIDSGVDLPVSPPRRLAHLGAHVRFGFPPGPPPRDPADPGRRLTDLDDPIRFNRSDIASFNPLGESTPGSVYLTDSQRHLAAVRLFGRTGKVRVIVYDPETETWSEG